MFFKRSFAPFLALGLAFFSQCAAAAVTSATVRDMQFGLLNLPVSGSQYIQISATANNSYTGTGTLISGTPNRAQYTITNSDNVAYTVDISINNISTGSATVTLNNFTGRWRTTNIASFPAVGLSLLRNSSATFYLGARMTYTPSTPEGNRNMTFDIVVTYN